MLKLPSSRRKKKNSKTEGTEQTTGGVAKKKKKLSVVHGDFVERRVGALLGCSFNRQRRS